MWILRACRSWTTPWHRLLSVVVVVLVTACGGGGTPDGGKALPAAVTQTLSAASGGHVEALLANGGSVLLDVAPGTFVTDTAVTLRPLLSDAQSPVRFEITPPIARFARPATLRVQLPPGVDSAQSPVLRWHGGAWIATRVLAGDQIEATLGTPARTAAAGLRSGAQALKRRAVADAEPPSQIDVNLFMIICTQPADAVAAARSVFEHDTNPAHIHEALAMLTNLRNNCGQVVTAEQAVQALQTVVAEQLPAAERAWVDVDHRDLTQLAGFQAGLTRLLTWCAAGLQLGMALDCPASAALSSEFAEVLEAFTIAIGLADDLATFQRQGAELVQLAATAQLLGIPGKTGLDLLRLAGTVGTRIVDRAYALCSMVDMLPWTGADASLPGAYAPDVVQDAMLVCGSRVPTRVRDALGQDIADAALEFHGGDAQGNGALGGARTAVPPEGSVVMRFTGPAMRCTRVIGSPAGPDEIVWRVGAVEIARRSHDGNRFDGPDVVWAMPALRSALGRAADSREPIVIEMWRVNLAMECGSVAGTQQVTFPDTRLYTLMLTSTETITILPPEAAVPMFGSQTFDAAVTGLADGAVDWSSSGGTIDAAGHFTAPAVPGSYTVTATSRAQPALKAQATVTVAMPVGARLTLAIGTRSATTTSGTDWRLFNQQVFIASIDQTDSAASDFAAGPITTTAAPTLDSAGNLVFTWLVEMPAAMAAVRWNETYGSRRTETTRCGPHFADTVLLVNSLSFSASQFDTAYVGARLTLTPSGKAMLSLGAEGRGPAQGTNTSQRCISDGLDGGILVNGPPGPLGSNFREGGTNLFDWLTPGRETAPIAAANVVGTRELTWNGGSGQEVRDMVERSSKVNADPATALYTVGRRVTVTGWTISLQ